jgi:hypothetical protein
MPETLANDTTRSLGRFASASTTGLTLEIGPGVEIWTCEDGRRNSHEEPLGGYVVEAFAGASGFDTYGEHFEKPTSYRTFDPFTSFDKAFRVIDENEVNMQSLAVPTSGQLVGVIRTFARELGKAKQARGTRRHGSGILSSFEIDLGRYIGALTKVIGAGVAPVAVERPLPRRVESDEF